MRVLHLNTSAADGGAAIAASRIVAALQAQGVDATMLFASGLRHRWAFLWERLRIFAANGFRRERLWQVDIANAGVDVTRTESFRKADVVHLHWVNQGFLSMDVIRRIMRSGKPVVWTMHDMWPVTAICHHARTCQRFHSDCHNCPRLFHPAADDLAAKVFLQKREAYDGAPLAFVACSQWLAAEARRSSLTRGHSVTAIPNTFPADIFHPGDSSEARRKLGLPDAPGPWLLFACQKVTNPRKGINLLLEALTKLPRELGGLHVVVAGELAESVAANIPYPVHALGYVRGEEAMANLYRAVDAFVTPSLEENLPNTIMEAMASGTPCVGFDIGGIPEMIVHERTGYIARYADTSDLAAGIAFVLRASGQLGIAAASTALDRWGAASVAGRYVSFYKSML